MPNTFPKARAAGVILGLSLLSLLATFFSDRVASSNSRETTNDNQTILVPSVKGERTAVAQQILRLAGLKSESGVFYIAPDKWRDDLREGVVSMQAPQADQSLAVGGTVALWTFQKAEKEQKVVKTPDLTGKTRKEVEQALKNADLAPTEAPAVEAGEAPDDKAVAADQYPRPDQSVYAKTAVFVRYRSK